MKNGILKSIIIIIFFCFNFNLLVSDDYLLKYTRDPFEENFWIKWPYKNAYVTDRDNYLPNGYASNFTVKDGYLYILIDTGNVGILKLFKIIDGTENHKGRDYRDDFIEWNVYFGDNNNYYLPKGHLLFNKGENLRLVLQQREDDYHNRIRIIDVNTEGQVIFEKELGITFGKDLIIAENIDMTAENYGEVFTGIYTEKFDGEKSYVKVVQFTANGEIIHSTNIKDDNYSLEAKQIQIAENGEIAVLTLYNKIDCHYNFIISVFDSNLHEICRLSDSVNKLLQDAVHMWRSAENFWTIVAKLKNSSPERLYKVNIELNQLEILPTHTAQWGEVPDWRKYSFIYEPRPSFRIYFYRNMFLGDNLCENNNNFFKSAVTHLEPIRGSSTIKCLDCDELFLKQKLMPNEMFYNLTLMCNQNNRLTLQKYIINLPTSVRENNTVLNTNISKYFSGDYSTISLPDNYYTEVTLCLYNVIGNKVSEYKLKTDDNSILVPISNLQNGIYFYYIPELNIKGKFGVSR
ncbi:MAG: hypothetical protein WHV28_00060 [Bacteroidota bacterium]